MPRVRLDPMTPRALDAWRRATQATRAAVPQPRPGEREEALTIVLDGVETGRVLLAATQHGGQRRWTVRAIETTLHSDDLEDWAAVLTAVAGHARDAGADLVDTAVPPVLAPAFEAVGYRTTQTRHAKRIPRDGAHFQEDRRVAVRPMTAEERARFASDAAALLASGALRDPAGGGPGTEVGLPQRVARLADEPPPADEVLLTATVAGVPVGRTWATLVGEDADGLDFVGHLIELFPPYRGLRLTPSFLGALARHVRHLGVRDVHLRLDGADERARAAFVRAGLEVADVHLRFDLGPEAPPR